MNEEGDRIDFQLYLLAYDFQEIAYRFPPFYCDLLEIHKIYRIFQIYLFIYSTMH